MDPITINVQINVGVTPALEKLRTRLLPGQATQTPNAPTAPVQQPEEAPAEIIEDAPADLFPLPGEKTPAAPVQQPEAAAPAQEAKEYTEVDVRAAMDRNMMGIFRGKARVLLSELKEADAAVLGASALGWE